MATRGGIEIVGLRETIKALEAIGVPNAEVAAASQLSGEIVASQARSLVPSRSGALRATIRSAKQARKVLVRAGSSKVPYANPIHWGWYYDKKNFVYKNIMPQPFFAEALKLTREQVLQTYVDNIDKLINKYRKY